MTQPEFFHYGSEPIKCEKKKKNVYVFVCRNMCVFLCVNLDFCVGVGTCVCMCKWKAEVNVGIISQEPSTLIFETEVSY